MNEITTLNNGKFELVPFTAETAETIREELDGLDGFRFDEVKIPSGGSLAFEVPGDDPETPEMATSIEGIIAYHHSANAYWEGSYTGDAESNAPFCVSNDGKFGYSPTGCTACDSCPNNEFGSADDHIGKACKNMKRVYILRSGETLPLVLVLPPTSIRPFREYLGRLVKRGKKPSGVITKVTLKKEKSQTGIVFSRACFEKVADLNAAETAQIADVRSALENFLSQQRPPETGDPDGIGHEVITEPTEPGEFTPF